MPRAVTETAVQLDAFITPGSLLTAARERQRMTQKEAAERLNLVPSYVALLERDEFQALPSPTFARGYVKAYGRLLGLDEQHLLAVFDQQAQVPPAGPQKRPRPPQLQRTGRGVVIGLGVFTLLLATLWWWEEGRALLGAPVVSDTAQSPAGQAPQYAGGDE